MKQLWYLLLKYTICRWWGHGARVKLVPKGPQFCGRCRTWETHIIMEKKRRG